MTVESDPCPTWSALLRQKQRWGVGGLDMVFRGLVIMGIGWLCKLLILAGIFGVSSPVLIAGILAKVALDGWVILEPLRRSNAVAKLRHLLVFEAFFILYVPLLPFVALLSKHRVVWKGRAIAQ